MQGQNFGNGRFVRRMLEEAEMNLACRIMELKEAEITDEVITTIDECDIPKYLPVKNSEQMRMGFA
ncbi:MAG: hypothetical protein K5886_05915 [Lachnospiraceae bacterium]|nr:hypothetical protein [Lachnospiraceae bacterium]